MSEENNTIRIYVNTSSKEFSVTRRRVDARELASMARFMKSEGFDEEIVEGEFTVREGKARKAQELGRFLGENYKLVPRDVKKYRKWMQEQKKK